MIFIRLVANSQRVRRSWQRSPRRPGFDPASRENSPGSLRWASLSNSQKWQRRGHVCPERPMHRSLCQQCFPPLGILTNPPLISMYLRRCSQSDNIGGSFHSAAAMATTAPIEVVMLRISSEVMMGLGENGRCWSWVAQQPKLGG